MNRMTYEGTESLEGSVIGHDDHLGVTKKVSLKHRILLSPFVKYGLPTFMAVACLLTAVYLTMYFVLNNSKDIWTSSCSIRASYRIDCFPGRLNVTYDECIEADCCWHDSDEFCFHAVPSRHGYTPKSSTESYQENEILVPRRPTSPFGSKNVESLSLNVAQHSDPNHVEIVLKIDQTVTREKRNVNEKRETRVTSFSNDAIFNQVPPTDDLSAKLLDFLPKSTTRRTVNLQTDPKSNMDVYVHTPEFSVTVTRKNDTSSRSLMSTARGPLILTKNFWEFTLYIANSSIYGLNKLELNGTTNLIYDNENGTSRLAFLGINDNGEGTSCYISHEGPMEIKVINESNLIVLRGLSLPSEISIHVFAGPTPLEAIRQLTKALRQYELDIIELSSLGLHVCPNDDSVEFIELLSELIESLKNNDAPWDSHCINQDFDSTLGNSMNDDKILIVKKIIERLAKEPEERTIVPHLSPMLFIDKNELSTKLANSSLLLRNLSEPYRGLYRKKNVFYPDWHDTRTHDESLVYLKNYMSNFGNSKLVYLRDSWPKDETLKHPVPDYPTFDYMPRDLQSLMTNGTLPYTLTSSSRRKSHYTEHASYSTDFRNFTRRRQLDLTSLAIRGSLGESGYSSWSVFRDAIRAGVGSGLVGQLPSPMYACGTGDELGPSEHSDELCSRWFGASVAWPHVLALRSNLPAGDHLTATSTLYIAQYLRLRASLATYANTILAQYYIDGSPILSPTSVHYPNDLQARNKWNQFMWGYGILVGLVTLPKVSQVPMWIPGKYPWRHLHGGAEVNPTKMGMTPITAVESQIVTLVRPGAIIPLHEKISMTTASTINSELTLVINLACDEMDCNADGKIFYGSRMSEGEFLIASANQTFLKLDNILRVKAKACNVDETKIIRQGTLIKYVIVLGPNFIRYNVNTNFCNINEDSSEILFDVITR